MDTSKQFFEAEKRKAKSKEIKIQFVTPFDFNVLDEEGSMKYLGNTEKCECTCMSWYYGMKWDKATGEQLKGESMYFREHGENFKCKHLLRALEILGKDTEKRFKADGRVMVGDGE